MLDNSGHFIGGEWDNKDDTFDVINPSNQTLYSKVADGSRESARAAVDAANAAFPSWSGLAFTERADFLEKFRAELLSRGPAVIAALAQETGAAMGIAMFQVKKTPEVIRAAVAATYGPEGEIIAYAIWVYRWFVLSTANVRDLLAERGIQVRRVAVPI